MKPLGVRMVVYYCTICLNRIVMRPNGAQPSLPKVPLGPSCQPGSAAKGELGKHPATPYSNLGKV